MGRSVLLFIVGASLIFNGQLWAQKENCEETLNLAAAEFDAGRFVGLPSILGECLKNGFSQEQKVRAYLLLTQAYLILDDPASAENSYLQLLKADPEYIANPTRDPIDVYYLSKKFTSTPIFTPHLMGGMNTSLPRDIYNINTGSVPNSISSKKVFKLGYQIGVGIDLNLSSNWSLCSGILYSAKSFKNVLDQQNYRYELSITEKESWFDIPLYLKYQVDSGKIRPFGYAGLAMNLLVNTNLTLSGTHQVDYMAASGANPENLGHPQPYQGPVNPINYKRNFLNRSLVFGGGVKYKWGKDFIYVDLRYMAGMTNLAKNSYTTSNGQFDPLLAQYGYSSNFFRLDNLSISFGYVRPLYNPRKKKKVISGLLEKLRFKRTKK